MFQEHVEALSIKDLRAALKNAGLQNGPITASTESVYRASLLKYLTDGELEMDPNSTLNSSSSDLEYIDSGSGSDVGEDLDENEEEVSEIPVEQVVLTDKPTPTVPKTQFTPIRWNPNLQKYESVYDESSTLNNEGDKIENHSKGIRKWLLLMAVAVVAMGIVIAMIFLSGERDLYKGFEDAGSRISTHGEVSKEQ